MGKYEPLIEFLKKSSQDEVPMTFDEIEKVIGRKLPNSAIEYRAWWSNNPMNSVLTKAWLDAGWKTEQVDMCERKLVFRKTGRSLTKEGEDMRPSIFGCLKGTVRIAPGTDLTEPTNLSWLAQEGKLHE